MKATHLPESFIRCVAPAERKKQLKLESCLGYRLFVFY